MPAQIVCNLSDLTEGQGREVFIGGQVLAIFLWEGEVFAIDGMCAHQGGPIAQGRLSKQNRAGQLNHVYSTCVTCPWHGWQYDLANGQNMLTGKKMLSCYHTEIRDDQVWIDLEDIR
jgi:nitrite reductase/ring-hydroxylating ferredoxin subunit